MLRYVEDEMSRLNESHVDVEDVGLPDKSDDGDVPTWG